MDIEAYLDSFETAERRHTQNLLSRRNEKPPPSFSIWRDVKEFLQKFKVQHNSVSSNPRAASESPFNPDRYPIADRAWKLLSDFLESDPNIVPRGDITELSLHEHLPKSKTFNKEHLRDVIVRLFKETKIQIEMPTDSVNMLEKCSVEILAKHFQALFADEKPESPSENNKIWTQVETGLSIKCKESTVTGKKMAVEGVFQTDFVEYLKKTTELSPLVGDSDPDVIDKVD